MSTWQVDMFYIPKESDTFSAPAVLLPISDIEKGKSIHLLLITLLAINNLRPFGGVGGFEFHFAFACIVIMVIFLIAHASSVPEFAGQAKSKSFYIPAIRTMFWNWYIFPLIKSKFIIF